MTLEIGRAAPDFTLKSQHGEDVTLSRLHDGKAVVVMFYPFAFSGICTGELCSVRDRLPDLSNDRVEVVAVSCDPVYALRVFSERDDLTFPLLSDFWPHGAVASAYGVFDAQRGCALRGTFIIDPGGVLRWKVENGLPDARDLGEYLRALEAIAA